MRGNRKKFGITKLLDGGVYKAAYPLHDVNDFTSSPLCRMVFFLHYLDLSSCANVSVLYYKSSWIYSSHLERFPLCVFIFLQCRFNVKSNEEGCPNERYLLYEEWAHPKSFYKMQPLDLIR